MSGKYTIVNEQDEVIGFKSREELAGDDIVRVSALWLTNSKSEVLLAKRASTKKYDADKWGPAAAGTVEADESYEENMLKEINEELGIKLKRAQLRRGPHMRRHGRNEYFCQWYFATLDLALEAFTIEPKEVDELRWVSRDWLTDKLTTVPDIFIKTGPNSWPELLELAK